METTRLEYLVALSHTGSVTAAAERLHVTPAAVSKALHALETDLDAKLMVRDGRGIAVTDAGWAIARRAEEILASIDTLRDHNALRVERTPAYRFGAYGYLATNFHADFVRSFHDCDVTMAELEEDALVAAIQRDVVDIGLATRPIGADGISCELICDMPMGVFARADLLREYDANITRLPFSVPGFRAGDSAFDHRRDAADGWPSGAPRRWNRFPVGTQQSAFELAIAGHAAVYAPRFVARRHNARSAGSHRLDEVPLPQDVARRARRGVHVLRRAADLNMLCVGKVAGPLVNLIAE